MGDDILNFRPTGRQEGIWETSTQLPFDPFVSSAALTSIDVECPRCERSINIRKSSLHRGWNRIVLNSNPQRS